MARLQDAQVRAALASALAQESDAQAAYARALALTGSTVSAGETRRRLAMLQEARANVTARQADVATMTHRFSEEYNSVTERSATGDDETSSLIAPMPGIVQDIPVAVAGDITAGQTALTMADLSSVWVVSELSPRDAARVAPGAAQDNLLPQGGGVRHVASKVATVDGAANPATGLVRVISVVPNRDGALRPGMMFDARIATAHIVAGIVLPSEAIETIDGQDVVFVATGPTEFQPIPVKVGLDDGTNAILLSGPEPGTRVVAHGSFALKSATLLASMSGD